jgi:hypothetical protein
MGGDGCSLGGETGAVLQGVGRGGDTLAEEVRGGTEEVF